MCIRDSWYSVREEGYFGEDELTTDPATGKKLTPNGTEVELSLIHISEPTRPY